MKSTLLSVLFLLPFFSFSQNSSWFELEFEFGGWDTNPNSVCITQGNDTLFFKERLNAQTPRYHYAVINANTGNINVEFGSNSSAGWYSFYNQTPSYFTLKNYSQGEIIDLYQLDWSNNDITWSTGTSGYNFDTVVNLLSQPPPIAGCTDPNSSSYNPSANLSNGQCTYPVSFAVDMNSYPDTFSQVYVSGQFNNWSGIWDSLSDPDGDNIWTGTIDILNNPGWLWKYSVDNWSDQELPPNMQNNQNPYATCFLLDAYGFTNRNLIVDGQAVVLDTNCWEKCLGCEDIIGCTDTTSEDFNPWATVSDGQCQGSNIPNCGPGQTYLQVYFVPDNYGSESSWILYDDNGAVFTAPQGTYSGYQPGVGVSEYICVDTNVLVDIVIQDSYGDGLNGTLYGGTVDGNLQVLDCNGNTLFNLADSVSNSNFGYLYTSPQFSTGSSCTSGGSSIVYGCTDPFSLNYNPNATVSDGSCSTLRVLGCDDNSQFNFDPNANTSEIMTGDYTLRIYDGQSNGWGGTWLGIKQGDWLSPQYQIGPDDGNYLQFDVPLNIYEPIELYLFTTQQSQNSIAQVAYTLYGPQGDTIVNVPYWGGQSIQFPVIQTTTGQPTFGDVCIPKVLGCTDSTATNYDSLANTDDGSCVPTIIGCMDQFAFNYDSTANTAGPCIPIVVGCLDSTQFNYDSTANTVGACIPFIYGCTDSSKFNYNSLANTDDNSCVPFIYGCTDATAFNYDSTANTNDNSCIAKIFGCTDSTSLNYNPLANTDNNSCIAKVYGCMTPTSINYNPLANVNDGSCIPFIYGCTDSTSFNYNALANTDDSSCVAIVYGCTNPNSTNYSSTANTDDGSCIPFIYGCTDSTAFNYNPLANTNNGSCIAVVYGCTNVNSINYNSSANVDDSTCIPIIYGCTDSTAFNYNPLANTNNNTCVAKVFGCTNVNSINYNPSANTDDGSCIPFIYGCTDSTMFNYNPLANTDNGTCVPFIYGCTDPNAFNYDPNANTNQVSSTNLSSPCIAIVYGCTDSTAVNYDSTANVDNGSCIAAVYGCTDPNAYNYNPNANVSDTTACLYDAGCIDGPGNPYWLNDPCYAWVIDVDEYCCTNSWDPDCQSLYDYCATNSGTIDIDELVFDNIVVYPNPTTGNLTIKTNLDITYELYDFTGKVINTDMKSENIDISNLPNGVYFLSIKYEDKVFNKRIIKKD